VAVEAVGLGRGSGEARSGGRLTAGIGAGEGGVGGRSGCGSVSLELPDHGHSRGALERPYRAVVVAGGWRGGGR
jgi:hypothetical protein